MWEQESGGFIRALIGKKAAIWAIKTYNISINPHICFRWMLVMG